MASPFAHMNLLLLSLYTSSALLISLVFLLGPFLFPLGRVHILEDRSLKLDDVTLEDMGEYSCEADNAVGSITATGILTVHGKLIAPPILSSPT